jgi:hypothetical protein
LNIVPLLGPSPALHLNPGDDEAFAADVDRLFAIGVRDAAEFQERLRVRYPDATVRPRDLVFEPYVVWYVYRDGKWVHPE